MDVVAQAQWQSMATMWSPDRVNFQLTGSSYGSTSLPFYAKVLDNRTIEIAAGSAWVGGFFYQLSGTKSITVPANAGDKPRKDLIAIQVDLAKSAANIVLVQGAPAATPQVPQPRRQPGGLWEMPLYEVLAGARNASVSATGRMPFAVPGPAAYPWNTTESAALQPRGAFIYDMDNNGGDSPYEAINTRDGYVITRNFAKSRTYTPSILGGGTVPESSRWGRWRWIAPNMIWFSVVIENPATTDVKLSGDNWIFGVSLPVHANGKTGQVIAGHIDNNGTGGAVSPALPNFSDVIGKIGKGGAPSAVFLYIPSPVSTKSGLDGLSVIPRKGTLTLSGVYEANQFDE
ncbi:hypothetical protein [Streptomyces buecherae]|uniref:hypothetical protein n=1 Tax=Streptomyces buecherae TaxID=2763006 RepID=UPI0037B008CC